MFYKRTGIRIPSVQSIQSTKKKIIIIIYISIDKVNLGTEISTTKQLSENVAQPGIEPGSPDYRSDALTTQPLNQPRWEYLLLYNAYTVLALRWSGPRRQFHTFSAIRITSLLPCRSVMHGHIPLEIK